MRNMGTVIKEHNTKITKKKIIGKMRGKCLTSKVVYTATVVSGYDSSKIVHKATVVSGNGSKIFIRLTVHTEKEANLL